MGCDLPVPQGKPLLANCEGLTLRVASDGQPYTLELTTGLSTAGCHHPACRADALYQQLPERLSIAQPYIKFRQLLWYNTADPCPKIRSEKVLTSSFAYIRILAGLPYFLLKVSFHSYCMMHSTRWNHCAIAMRTALQKHLALPSLACCPEWARALAFI